MRKKQGLAIIIFIISSMMLSLTTLYADVIEITETGLKKSTSRTGGTKLLPPTVTLKEVPMLKQLRIKPGAEVVKTLNVTVDITKFELNQTVADYDTYHTLAVPGWQSHIEEGKPAVPTGSVFIEIPGNVKAQVTMRNAKHLTLHDVTIMPMQPARPESIDKAMPFMINRALYMNNAYFPANTILGTKIIQMRDKNYLEVTIAPFRFNPVSESVIIAHDMELEIQLITDQTAADGPRTEFNNVRSQNGLEKYMILMDEQFYNNEKLAEFIQWKKCKGLDVRVVTTEDINPNGAPVIDEITAYMRNLPADQYPEYLLIIGGHDKATGVAGTYIRTWFRGFSDLYTACRTETDFIPDLAYGRLPARNNTELTSMLDKILDMELYPPSTRMYDRVIIAGQIQDSTEDPDTGVMIHNNIADRLFCETADMLDYYFTYNDDGINYSVTRGMTNPHNVTSHCKWNAESLMWPWGTQIGMGVYSKFVSDHHAKTSIHYNINHGVSIVQHRDHGDVNGWGQPSFQTPEVNALSNGNFRPLVFSINCLTGAYHRDNNFTRAWLNHDNGGAYGVISAVDVSFSWYNDYLTYGLYAAFFDDFIPFQNASRPKNLAAPQFPGEGSTYALGKILNYAKNYVYQHYGTIYGSHKTFELFHLFGDPEMSLYLHKPKTFSVNHLGFINSGTVTIKAGTPNARVSLYSEEVGIHETKLSNASGIATFDIYSSRNGTIDVTITKPGYRPYKNNMTYVPGNNALVFPAVPSAPAYRDTPWSIKVTLYNNGSTTWGKGYTIEQFSARDWDVLTKPVFYKTVAPGQSITLTLSLIPKRCGNIPLYFQMAYDRETFGQPSATMNITVQNPDKAEITNFFILTLGGIEPNDRMSVFATVKNTGITTWDGTKGYNFVIARSWGKDITTSFPAKTVKPGESVTINIPVTAPFMTGSYSMTICMKKNTEIISVPQYKKVMFTVSRGIMYNPESPSPVTLR